jgi:hypothetical protein
LNELSNFMQGTVNSIIKVIAPLNNRYRDASSSPREKLEALWEMGEQLISMGVTKPHSVGWAVQRETKGLIKRPTVFRSHKIRTIWTSKDELIRNLGDIRGLSNLTEILPLLDPAQKVRANLTQEHIQSIYQHACSDPPQKFKRYIANSKREFSHGRLGKTLDKSRHLDELATKVSAFKVLLSQCLTLVNEPNLRSRDAFRANTSIEELRAFSNMCIALTTKDNFRLYKRRGPPKSHSKNEIFEELYNHFRQMLDKTTDVERARLRRVISAEALAQMSDIISSLSTEEAVRDFRDRQRIAISL